MIRWAFLLCLSAAAAFGQVKIAVINVQNAILETAEIKKAQGEMETRFKPRQQKLEALQKELSDLQNRLQTGGDKMSPQQVADLQATGQRKQREAQHEAEDLQTDVDRDRNDILKRTGDRMVEVVRKLAEAKGVDVVLDQSSTLYIKQALDITKEATAEYDKAHPAK